MDCRADHEEAAQPLPLLLTLETPPIKSSLVRKVQQGLRTRGFNPGKIDGEYGPYNDCRSRFQASSKLVADGVCRPLTAKKLDIDWPE